MQMLHLSPDDPAPLGAALRAAGADGGRSYLVKVNWYGPDPGGFTDARTLDFVLSALPGPAVLLESHSVGRNDSSRHDITAENAWENREWIRSQHEQFLDRTGLRAVMARHGARFVNVTEAVWAGLTAPSEAVQAAVEARFGPLQFPELYGCVPLEAWELRGAPLVSLARVKVPAPSSDQWSLSLKNLFGLIPDVCRLHYHPRLAQAIVDINKVWRALFPTVGLCEAIFHTLIYAEPGEYRTAWGGYVLKQNEGLAWAGRDPVALDLTVARHYGAELAHRTLYRLAAPVFSRD
jgi:hypothetical protein